MFTIQDGRECFFQWDKDRKLIVEDGTIDKVHFSNNTSSNALVCETHIEDGKTVVNVPNELLTNSIYIDVYAWDETYTKHSARFMVQPRSKPADYIYTEDEYWTAEKAVEAALEEAKASGDFKGEKGDKGDAGAIKFIVVTELPTESIDGSAIYLLATDGADQNAYNEYIYTNGAWELIGSASVEIDLTDYVKNTDYASVGTYGLVKTTSNNDDGVLLNNGVMSVSPATTATIDSRKTKRPITPTNLDYAVKVGLTTNTETLTDEEKAAACEWLGTLPKVVVASPKLYGADPSGTFMYSMSANADKWTVAQRGAAGVLTVGTPTADSHATTKAYVDGLIAELQARIAALESNGGAE